MPGWALGETQTVSRVPVLRTPELENLREATDPTSPIFSRSDSAFCNCLSRLRYARLSRYVSGERCYSSNRGSSCPPLGVTAGDGPFRDAASGAWPCRMPGRSGWLRCELGTGAQADIVRGGAPGGGAVVGDGLAG